MFEGKPHMCTGMMAFVRGVIFLSTSSGSMVSDSSISAMIGAAPTARAARAVAMKV